METHTHAHSHTHSQIPYADGTVASFKTNLLRNFEAIFICQEERRRCLLDVTGLPQKASRDGDPENICCVFYLQAVLLYLACVRACVIRPAKHEAEVRFKKGL